MVAKSSLGFEHQKPGSGFPESAKKMENKIMHKVLITRTSPAQISLINTFWISSWKHCWTFNRVFALHSKNKHPFWRAKAIPSSLLTTLVSSCKKYANGSLPRLLKKVTKRRFLRYDAHLVHFVSNEHCDTVGICWVHFNFLEPNFFQISEGLSVRHIINWKENVYLQIG